MLRGLSLCIQMICASQDRSFGCTLCDRVKCNTRDPSSFIALA